VVVARHVEDLFVLDPGALSQQYLRRAPCEIVHREVAVGFDESDLVARGVLHDDRAVTET
jgi:hypothetical protein